MNEPTVAIAIALVLAGIPADGATYRGIEVAAENRCAPYDRGDYRYPQSVEQRIVETIGQVYGPYTGTCFAGTGQTDVEHIVAVSEAHDSGLCAADATVKREFASDVLNLTLASPTLNRQKGAKDVAEWTPRRNACWYAARTLEVRRKYGLTIDPEEAEAVEAVLSRCASTEMVVGECRTEASEATSEKDADADALAQWDDNGNGRITCAEARKHGIAPVHIGTPRVPVHAGCGRRRGRLRIRCLPLGSSRVAETGRLGNFDRQQAMPAFPWTSSESIRARTRVARQD